MPAPIVVLTSTTKEIGGLMRVRLNEAYVDAVLGAGLTPLVLPPLDPPDVEGVADAISGIVFTGGEDVDPAVYGAERGTHTTNIHGQRDRCELALLQRARERRLPTLAICRGIQLVNVGLGGTLVQDIPSECPSAIEHDRPDDRTMRVHDVSIEPGTKLAAAIGASRVPVNSSHHQAVARIADGLRVTARSPDGIIEGAEWVQDDWWMVAVQWHPEELVGDGQPWDRGLFRAFADAVRR